MRTQWSATCGIAAASPKQFRGADTIISTANSMARVLGGEKSLTIADVDVTGHADLIAAAEAAGVQRFLFLSFQGAILESATPFSNAKRAIETRLTASPIHEVIVPPDMFQEVWLTPMVSFNWPKRKFTIFGKGESMHRYVAVDDVASGVVNWALADDPPRLVEFGGPEGLTRNQAVDLFEQALGARVQRRHIPRPALAAGATLCGGSGPTSPLSWVSRYLPTSSHRRPTMPRSGLSASKPLRQATTSVGSATLPDP